MNDSSISSFQIPPLVQFWTYAISDALSIFCSLFVLYHFLSDRTLRHALNNHIIIVLLFIGFIHEITNIPWTLYRILHRHPWILTPTFYLFTFFFDYGIYSTQIALFTWATIERHILIFHDGWLATKKRRLLLHYLPIAAILIYCFIYYSLVAFGPFCPKSFEMYLALNAYVPCVFDGTVLGTWDLLFHQVVTTLLIVIFSIGLIVRVIRQKRRRNQRMQWRKHRKMTIQLISISVLYSALNIPWTVLVFASQYGVPEDALEIPTTFAIYIRNYIIFIFPFLSCVLLPDLREKCRKLLFWKRINRIHAQELPHTR